MTSYKFEVKLLIKLLALGVLWLLFVHLVFFKQWYFTAALTLACVVFLTINLVASVRQTNMLLARYINAVNAGDSTRAIAQKVSALGYQQLVDALNISNERIHEIKQEAQSQTELTQILLNHISVGIMLVDQENDEVIINKSLGELLGVVPIQKLSKMSLKIPTLFDQLSEIESGKNQLIALQRGLEMLKVLVQKHKVVVRNQPKFIYTFYNMTEELEENEIQSWEKLLRVLTHEIMNSLAPIVSLTDTLSSITQNQRKLKEYPSEDYWVDVEKGLATITKRNEGTLRFVQEYRSLLKIPEPVFDAVKVGDLMGGVKMMYAAHASSKSIDFSVFSEVDQLRIRVDEAMIEQVLINLIKNAIEAVESVSCPKIRIAVEPIHEGVQIFVEDNGVGIEADMKEQIFVPFFTTKQSGTGVGLSLSKIMVQKNHGKVLVESEPGKTTFTVILPLI